MASTLVITVGNDARNPKSAFWSIKKTFSHDLVYKRTDFESLDAAKGDLEKFKKDLAEADIIEMPIISRD